MTGIDWSKRKVWSSEAIRAEQWEVELGDWGSDIEVETRRRIRLAVAAFAYEVHDKPIISDAAFDKLAQSIRPRMGTCHPLLDEFFITRFSPMTGMWIHDHPELRKIKALYDRFYRR